VSSAVTILQQRELLLERLSSMPGYLEAAFAGLTPAEAATSLSPGEYSPVEQAWHLADLEREGYAVRIRRLLEEDAPHLADFDGQRIAAERNYRALSLCDGLAAFRAARLVNVALLRDVPTAAWARGGTLEGVGPVALCDLPALMDAHDAAHRAEIEEWRRARGSD
jgi:hypothetical protein